MPLSQQKIMNNEQDFAFSAGVATATAIKPEFAPDFLGTDADAPAEPISPFDVRPDVTRGVFFAGDVLTPSQKRTRPDLKHGGEYLGQQFKTLARSKFIVYRGQLTPLVKAY